MSRKTKLLIIILLIIVLPATVYVAQKSTEYRREAGADSVGISILPSERDIGIGQPSGASITLNTGSSKVDAADLVLIIKANENVLDWDKTDLISVIGSDQAFDENIKLTVGNVTCSGGTCIQELRLSSIASRGVNDLKAGTLEAGRISLVGLNPGQVEIKFVPGSQFISGPKGSFQPTPLYGAIYTVKDAGEIVVGPREVNLNWDPIDGSTVIINKPFEAYLSLESAHKIDAAEIEIKYNPSELKVERANLDKEEWGNKDHDPYILKENIDESAGVISLGIGVGDPSLSREKFNFATLRMRPLVRGPINLTVTKSDISGYNPDDPLDSNLNLVKGDQINWSGEESGIYPELTFRVKMEGTEYTSGGKPVVVSDIPNQPITVVVRKDDFIQEYRTMVNFNQQAVGTGRLVLDQARPGYGYSVLIKGPKHLGSRFCYDKQVDYCGLDEAKIDLTAGENNFDWTGYPLQPGDLNQDGVINALDFSILKSGLGKRGSSIPEDLNYNGIVDGQDIVIFLNTLGTRYDDEI